MLADRFYSDDQLQKEPLVSSGVIALMMYLVFYHLMTQYKPNHDNVLLASSLTGILTLENLKNAAEINPEAAITEALKHVIKEGHESLLYDLGKYFLEEFNLSAALMAFQNIDADNPNFKEAQIEIFSLIALALDGSEHLFEVDKKDLIIKANKALQHFPDEEKRMVSKLYKKNTGYSTTMFQPAAESLSIDESTIIQLSKQLTQGTAPTLG